MMKNMFATLAMLMIMLCTAVSLHAEDNGVESVVVTASNTGSSLRDALNGRENSVTKLKIDGTINCYDVEVLQGMQSLLYLDLQDAKIVACTHPSNANLTTVNDEIGAYFLRNNRSIQTLRLPDTVKRIHDGACQDMMSLGEVYIGKETTDLGIKANKVQSAEGVFWNDKALHTVVWGGNDVRRIAAGTFVQCDGLTEIEIPEGVKELGTPEDRDIKIDKGLSAGVFAACKNLVSVKLPHTLREIPSCAFLKCEKIATIEIPSGVESLGYFALRECTLLTSVTLPISLTTIANGAFEGCSTLKELVIPGSISSIGMYAFTRCTNLSDIYFSSLEPPTLGHLAFNEDSNLGTIYVPRFSLEKYTSATEWRNYSAKIMPFDPDPICLNIDFVLEENQRFVDTPNIWLYPQGGLTVRGTEKQMGNELVLMHNGGKEEKDSYGNNIFVANAGSYVPEAGATIVGDKLTYKIAMKPGQWHFVSFPFDVPLSSVKYSGQYVFRYYDSAQRASQATEKSNWKNVESDVLKAGQGYIVQGSKADTLSVSSVSPILNGNDMGVKLTTYTGSKGANHVSWNFVGNPYPCYYPLGGLVGFTANVTVWMPESKTYMAYTAVDDANVCLSPLQAFFVQKPSSHETIPFVASQRLTQRKSVALAQKNAPLREADTDRHVVDIVLQAGEKFDRTRIVFNNERTEDYEVECDAAKFYSTEAAVQLYTEANEIQYAINERHYGADEIAIVFSAQSDGELTLKATRMEEPMLLTDLYLGITIDLSKEVYTFWTEAGLYDDRFEVRLQQVPQGIENLLGERSQSIYDIQGRKQKMLHPGMNIVNGKIMLVR